MNKYIFTGLTRGFEGIVLHQIQRISDKLIGGWIESEKNLSQENDNAWVYGDALVYGNARVSGHARVYGDALVYGNARVSGHALVYGNAWVAGNAWVYGNAQVAGNARVYGDALVYGNARVSGHALVDGNARVSGHALVSLPHRCINLINLHYNITVTPQNIVIGCQIKTHKEWLKVTQKEAIFMGLPKNHFKTFKTLLLILMKEVSK